MKSLQGWKSRMGTIKLNQKKVENITKKTRLPHEEFMEKKTRIRRKRKEIYPETPLADRVVG